jgi:hypothetical protein
MSDTPPPPHDHALAEAHTPPKPRRRPRQTGEVDYYPDGPPSGEEATGYE